jgi:hypothetical protein
LTQHPVDPTKASNCEVTEIRRADVGLAIEGDNLAKVVDDKNGACR